jgi:hypothetical protein
VDVGSFTDVSEILAKLTTLLISTLKKEALCTSETLVALGISKLTSKKIGILVMLCTCTGEVLGSNLGLYIDFPDCGR